MRRSRIVAARQCGRGRDWQETAGFSLLPRGSIWMQRVLAIITAAVLVGLGGGACDLASPPAMPPTVSGLYREDRPLPTTSAPTAFISPDTATYALQINERDGFVHGLWTITGDSTQPTDPWEAVVTGDYRDGRMIVEYHDPIGGQCRLAGPLDPTTGFTAEQRCAEAGWEVADTFRLVRKPDDKPTGPAPDLTDDYDIVVLKGLVTGGRRLDYPEVTGGFRLEQLSSDEDPAVGTVAYDVTVPDGLGGWTRIIDEGTYANWASGEFLWSGSLVQAVGSYAMLADTLMIEIKDPPLNRGTTWLVPGDGINIWSTVFEDSLGVNLAAMTLLPSGLFIRDLVVGEGASVGQQQGARFKYQGWLHDGTPVSGGKYPVDKSSPGAFVSPFDGEVYYLVGSGQTIAAWDIGLEGMRVGGVRQIVVPPKLGFGAGGSLDGGIPSNAVLVYRFELLAVEP